MSTTPTPPPTERTFHCIRCGYNLFGLNENGACPECGTPVERSKRGDLLEYCGEEYLASLHMGVFLIQTSIIVMLVTKILSFVLTVLANIGFAVSNSGSGTTATASRIPVLVPLGVLEPLSKGFDFLTVAMAIYGWWRLSSPDPGQLSDNKGDRPRRLIRIAMMVMGFSALVQFVTTFLHLPSAANLLHIIDRSSSSVPLQSQDVVELSLLLLSACIQFFAYVAWVVAFFAAMNYIRWLSTRIPNIKSFTRAGRLRWLGPLLWVVGAMCLMIGPLVALVLYYNLLDWLRKDLKNIRAKIAGAPATAMSPL